jgi:ribonuclease Z
MTIHGSPGTLDVVVRMLAGLWGEEHSRPTFRASPTKGSTWDGRGAGQPS